MIFLRIGTTIVPLKELGRQDHQMRRLGPQQRCGHCLVRKHPDEGRPIGGELGDIGRGYRLGRPGRGAVALVVEDEDVPVPDHDSIDLAGEQTPIAELRHQGDFRDDQ